MSAIGEDCVVVLGEFSFKRDWVHDHIDGVQHAELTNSGSGYKQFLLNSTHAG
jgi:hypothetical protein